MQRTHQHLPIQSLRIGRHLILNHPHRERNFNKRHFTDKKIKIGVTFFFIHLHKNYSNTDYLQSQNYAELEESSNGVFEQLRFDRNLETTPCSFRLPKT